MRLLKGLAAAIQDCDGFRFYSVSLLLSYDSTISDEEFQSDDYTDLNLRDKIVLKLIDFAHTTFGQNSTGPDTDLLTGIQNLTKCLIHITEDAELEPYLSLSS